MERAIPISSKRILKQRRQAHYEQLDKAKHEVLTNRMTSYEAAIHIQRSQETKKRSCLNIVGEWVR